MDALVAHMSKDDLLDIPSCVAGEPEKQWERSIATNAGPSTEWSAPHVLLGEHTSAEAVKLFDPTSVGILMPPGLADDDG